MSADAARHLRCRTEGSGPDLVFMHGLGADRHQAERALAGLRGYRVTTIDLPGHGLSPISPAPSLAGQVSFAAYADAVRQLLDRLGVGPAVVGGISMGAGIALRLALDVPDRVLGLLLVRPAWLDTPAHPHLDLVADIGTWLARHGACEARRRLLIDRRLTAMRATAPACADGVIDTIDRPSVRSWPLVLPTMVADRPVADRSRIAACEQPALVVATASDPLHPEHIAHELAASLPAATFAQVPPRYLQPSRHTRACVAVIDDFLALHAHSHHDTPLGGAA